MVASADIVNRSLNLAGCEITIGDLQDGTREAQIALRHYTQTVWALLRAQDHEFSRKVATLALSGNTAPLGWSFEYVYPADCLKVRSVPPATRANPVAPVRWDVGTNIRSGIGGATVSVAGSGYAVGDTGTVNVTTGPPATYRVLSVSSGAVATFTITFGGLGYSVGTAPTTRGGAQPGAGSGFVISIGSVVPNQITMIWTNIASASLVYTTNQVTEDDWGPLFTETVVQYLSSSLAPLLTPKDAKGQQGKEGPEGYAQAARVMQLDDAKDS